MAVSATFALRGWTALLAPSVGIVHAATEGRTMHHSNEVGMTRWDAEVGESEKSCCCATSMPELGQGVEFLPYHLYKECQDGIIIYYKEYTGCNYIIIYLQ